LWLDPLPLVVGDLIFFHSPKRTNSDASIDDERLPGYAIT
jgi:hypothetical protein